MTSQSIETPAWFRCKKHEQLYMAGRECPVCRMEREGGVEITQTLRAERREE